MRGHEPLSIDEVEALLTRLQEAAPHQEGSEPTVSSVSTVSTDEGGAS